MHLDNQSARSDVVELDAERFISLQFERRWPKYVVEWSVRRRAGESDFPLAKGNLERLPSKEGDQVDTVWEEMRVIALEQAREANARIAESTVGTKPRRSLLDRLLGRT